MDFSPGATWRYRRTRSRHSRRGPTNAPRAATVLAGRTCSGKTTLGLALALEPGAALLSDEFCPVGFAGRRVAPLRGLREFARHLVNAVALEGRLEGRLTPPALLAPLAPLFDGMRFFALRPGPLDETVRLVRERVLAR